MPDKAIRFMSKDQRDKWAMFFAAFASNAAGSTIQEVAHAADVALGEYRNRDSDDAPDKIGACGEVNPDEDTKREE